MVRFAPGLFGLAMFALWIWAVLDVIATERILTRNLDKVVWLLLVIFVPTVGAVAWIALGRPANAGFKPGATTIRPSHLDRKAAPRGPEDSDAWRSTTRPSTPIDTSSDSTAAKERRLLEWEAELKKREANLEDPDEAD
jgi:hypothetical protein